MSHALQTGTDGTTLDPSRSQRLAAWSANDGAPLIALGLIAAVAVALTTSTFIVVPISELPANVSVLVALAVVFLACERTPRTWIRVADGNTVTLAPAFGYALVLLSPPVIALGVAVVAALVHGAARRLPWTQRLFAVGRAQLTVATAGLVLVLADATSPLAEREMTSWRASIAVIVAGLVILLLETTTTAIWLSVQRRVSFVNPLRRGFAAGLTALGALLSLAPIWIVGLHATLAITPMLLITTALVLSSAQRSLERAHEARHDPLTGLANRRAFAVDLEDACGGLGRPAAAVLLVMDLDGFKNINDSLGHDVGDAVLVAFADRLREALPPNATAARLGGDEFAVLVTWSRPPHDSSVAIEGLHRELSEPLDINGFPLSVGVSIGAAHLGRDGTVASDLLRAADVAMYRSKQLGSDVEEYHYQAGSLDTGRLGLLADLGDATRNNELRVDYQPQLSMRTGQTVAVEALVRWQHPKHGTIAPNDFISLAEQTDLIGPITDMVIQIAAGGMMMAGESTARLAVNVSVRNLQDPDFARSVLGRLAAIGFPPERLELEVTEKALITNAKLGQRTISELRGAGVTITVDGFGTGYASYQTLRALQIDRIKIDRDFILRVMSDEQDQAIVASIVDLAHTLGREVIAEGIEGGDTWDLLAGMGCDAAQGFGIAMPMTLTELRTWMTRRTQGAALIP